MSVSLVPALTTSLRLGLKGTGKDNLRGQTHGKKFYPTSLSPVEKRAQKSGPNEKTREGPQKKRNGLSPDRSPDQCSSNLRPTEHKYTVRSGLW